MLITLAGYLINDFYDYEIDQINKPSAHRFTRSIILKFYFGSIIIGLLIAVGIANSLGNLNYLFVYLVATGLLFLYASYFKGFGLSGNLIVSIFSSMVIAIIWFVFYLYCGPIVEQKAQTLILFMCFVFLSSLAREIIKDCQDIEGDSKFNLKTLPIRIGVLKTSIFINFILLALILTIGAWLYSSYASMPLYKTLILGSTIWLIAKAIYLTNKARTSKDFKLISGLLKICMAIGITYLFTLSLSS